MRTYKQGERAGWGLSRREPFGLQFLIPLLPWYGRAYQIEDDEYIRGWWILCFFWKSYSLEYGVTRKAGFFSIQPRQL